MTRAEQTINAIRDVLLYILLFITAISYHPVIINASRIAGYESGTILSRYIILLFGVVFILSLSVNFIKKSRLSRVYIIWLTIIFAVALFIQAFFRNRDMVRELRAFAIVFGAIMIGYDLKIEKRQRVFMILVFCITVLFSGVMQVIMNNGGFVIANQYLTDAKNSLGAMLATSCFLSVYLFLTLSRRLSKSLAIALFLASFLVMVTIRARMAMVALLVVGLYYYFLTTKNRGLILTILIGVVVLCIGFLFLPSSVLNYIEASFTAGTQGEDFTSGRMYTYLQAISYLLQNPLMGNVQKFNQIGWIHNYPLLKLYDYGLLFSWPILVLYVYICIYTIKLSRHSQPLSTTCLGSTCLLIPYLISMAEPTFPFGPGTVTLFNFILLGMAEKEKLSQKGIR